MLCLNCWGSLQYRVHFFMAVVLTKLKDSKHNLTMAKPQERIVTYRTERVGGLFSTKGLDLQSLFMYRVCSCSISDPAVGRATFVFSTETFQVKQMSLTLLQIPQPHTNRGVDHAEKKKYIIKKKKKAWITDLEKKKQQEMEMRKPEVHRKRKMNVQLLPSMQLVVVGKTFRAVLEL